MESPRGIKTSRGYIYSYIYNKPVEDGATYLLFLHGFPSSSYDWRHQIQCFSQKGYGIIAPDLLGYGETAKPLEVEAYKGKDMVKDIIEILDHEEIQLVVGIGHDWYSSLSAHFPLCSFIMRKEE
jgi:soluble epoxide hydrolase / lipid-phosphate phosphatase